MWDYQLLTRRKYSSHTFNNSSLRVKLQTNYIYLAFIPKWGAVWQEEVGNQQKNALISHGVENRKLMLTGL